MLVLPSGWPGVSEHPKMTQLGHYARGEGRATRGFSLIRNELLGTRSFCRSLA